MAYTKKMVPIPHAALIHIGWQVNPENSPDDEPHAEI